MQSLIAQSIHESLMGFALRPYTAAERERIKDALSRRLPRATIVVE
jgi:hypothetical protein